VIFDVNFKPFSSLIKSAFVGIWTLYWRWKYCSPPKLRLVLTSSRSVTSKETLNFIMNTVMLAWNLARRHFFLIRLRWQTDKLINSINNKTCHQFCYLLESLRIRDLFFTVVCFYYLHFIALAYDLEAAFYINILGILRFHIKVSLG